MSAATEIARRRTFAIISHPDAGKTTLTEKFLLYGGALNLAGGVRDRKKSQSTASDWMELERQRGISVSSTVLQFDYNGSRVNLLDTPGHRDFSEDTYRVLMAVDAAVMVLDVAKGIEEQTRKLFEVCRYRGIPIFTFINKCDRPGREPLELLDEVENMLGLKCYVMNWPVGSGSRFAGVYERRTRQLHCYERIQGGRQKAAVIKGDLADQAIQDKIEPDLLAKLEEELELLEIAGAEFNQEEVLKGHQTPVFFGSAVNNFGVQPLLDGFLELAPSPGPRKAEDQVVNPEDKEFSAFIFKIQANMDPRHRDRLVFLRICSGKFSRDMQVIHTQTGRRVRLSFSHQLFGKERETQDEAWPGDVLGITGHSDFGIGDTLSENGSLKFDPIPAFAPECFSYLVNLDTRNFKRFRTGLEQLLQEKVIQRFYLLDAYNNTPLLGAVGPLQFDVVKHRIEGEYGAETRLDPAPWKVVRWVDPAIAEEKLQGIFLGGAKVAKDSQDRLVILFESEWNQQYFERENGDIRLYDSPLAIQS